MRNQLVCIAFIVTLGCSPSGEEEVTTEVTVNQDVIAEVFGDKIDVNNLFDYQGQDIPDYIDKDNTDDNPITNEGATLGRVLFYDVNLSIDNTIACASCHQQAFAFGDGLQASDGVDGTTGRHSMRLINSRFADEEKFFWDERASSLEDQTTKPIQDHIEMGFSGEDGNPDFDQLITKLDTITYYQELFPMVYGDTEITEERVQNGLAQFIRSIQSFDSKYDVGRAQVNRNNQPFPNFTNQENEGKTLFGDRPDFDNNGLRISGGAGCGACHRAPEFDIDPDSKNNGVIHSLSGASDTDVTRAPTLRDILNSEGELNGPLMHTGDMDMAEVIAHYNNVELSRDNNNLDGRLRGRQGAQQLNLSNEEMEALTAFLATLSGSNVYTAEQWSDPFEK